MAEQADQSDRTEAPTPRRIEQARKRGETANSRDLSAVIVLGAALIALAVQFAGALGGALAEQARFAWSGAEIRASTLGDYHAVLLHHGAVAARGVLPFALVLMGAGVLANVAQTGPLIASEALAFRGSRIDPIKGMKRLVSLERLFDLAKAPLKIGVVAIVLYSVMRPALGPMLSMVGGPPQAVVAAAQSLSLRVAGLILMGLAFLAVLDLAWVRHRYTRRLRMTPREIRDEMREREGSPQIRSRRRQLQRELSSQRMIAEVANADVVITNPTHYAVALRYVRSEMDAPRVIARGRNHVARRIREVARENDVPIVENPPLARVLFRATKVGRDVPEDLFQAVAEVLAYVYRLDRRRAGAWGAAT